MCIIRHFETETLIFVNNVISLVNEPTINQVFTDHSQWVQYLQRYQDGQRTTEESEIGFFG